MKNKQQLDAWKMIRLNKSLGLTGKRTLTQQKIKSYLNQYPATTELVRGILNNVTETPEQIAKLTGRTVGTIHKFYIHSIESVVLGIPKVGMALEISALKKALTRFRDARKETAVNEHVVNGKTVYSVREKDIIRDTIVNLMLDSRSPKTGIVPSLPYKFAMEEKILSKRALSGLTFHGYETGYAPGKRKESIKTQVAQKKILRNNKKLAKSVAMRYGNINDAVQVGSSDQYAHMLLDYCNSLSANRDTINYVLKNDLVKKGGIIEITLCARSNEKDSKKQLAKLIKKYADRYCTESIPQLKLAKLDKNMVGSEIKGLHYYSSSERGMGGIMYVVIFRRVK